MKNKKIIEYSGQDLINNPSLLLNKFEYYVNVYNDNLIFLFYYYKIDDNAIYYYNVNSIFKQKFHFLQLKTFIKDFVPNKKYFVF